jgi:hypothetical protein
MKKNQKTRIRSIVRVQKKWIYFHRYYRHCSSIVALVGLAKIGTTILDPDISGAGIPIGLMIPTCPGGIGA